jgi:hypothetical protein
VNEEREGQEKTIFFLPYGQDFEGFIRIIGFQVKRERAGKGPSPWRLAGA